MTEPAHDSRDDGDELPGPDLPAEDPASLAELEGGMRVLAERVDEIEDSAVEAIEALGAEVNELRDAVDDLIKKEKKDPPPPQRWADRATPADWERLIVWVDGIRLTLSLTEKKVIAPCWPAHPGVVEELAALRSAWVHAVVTDAKTPKVGTADHIAFYDRWFWPCLERLTTGSGYRITNCRDGHRPEAARSTAPTDRTLVPRAS